MRTENALDQMVSYLSRARSENLSFNEVCSSLQKFSKIAERQQKFIEKRNAERNSMLSLADLQTESQKRIAKYFLSGSNEDRDNAKQSFHIFKHYDKSI